MTAPLLTAVQSAGGVGSGGDFDEVIETCPAMAAALREADVRRRDELREADAGLT